MATESSKTEQALVALVAAIDEAMASGDPPPSRNEMLDKLLSNIGDGDGASINVIDGDQIDLTSFAGAAVANNNGYEIIHGPKVEICGVFKDPVARDATIDALMIKVHDAIAADRTLGGVVDFADTDIAQRSNLATEGIANCKGIILPVKLTFTSNRPF